MAARNDKTLGVALVAAGVASAFLAHKLKGKAAAFGVVAGLGAIGAGIVFLARGAVRQVGENIVDAVTAPFRPPDESAVDLPQTPPPPKPEPGTPTLPFVLEVTGAIVDPRDGGELDVGALTASYQVTVELENHGPRDVQGRAVLELDETPRPFGGTTRKRFASKVFVVEQGRRTRATLNVASSSRLAPSSFVAANLRWDDGTRQLGAEQWLAAASWELT